MDLDRMLHYIEIYRGGISEVRVFTYESFKTLERKLAFHHVLWEKGFELPDLSVRYLFSRNPIIYVQVRDKRFRLSTSPHPNGKGLEKGDGSKGYRVYSFRC